ncbi:hypothetical protein ACHAXM_011868 [Skeletonema potamos]|jgi:hypothetical protein
MATSHHDEWGDIPSSSDLFGGDFFGDEELMEMYADADGGDENDHHVIASLIGGPPHEVSAAAINSGPLKTSSTDDDTSKHPGILVALNAAAMDGDFSSSSDFVPVADVSNTKATTGKAKSSPSKGKSQAAKAPASSSPVSQPPAATTAAATSKRPVVTTSAASQPASKKRKPSPAKPTAIAPIQAKIATKGGVKVPVPASVKVPSPIAPLSTLALNRVVSSGTTLAATDEVVGKHIVPATAVARPTVATVSAKSAAGPTPASVKSAVISPKPGNNHQVIANPPATTAKFPVLSAVPTAVTAGVATKKPDVPTSSGSVGSAKRNTTEADFKDVASAAVSSLMQNASTTVTKPCPPKAPAKPTEKIDTSTAHVNALTSQNWVTACNPVPGTAESQSACDKAARNARRASLTQEERAKQNRDRNREHARNTRLRKKAYVEELKRTLTELVAQRDAAEVEKRHEAQRNREQREVRFRVMEEFLKLRGRNETNAARWIAILEEGFTFTLPRTTYRDIVDADQSPAADSNTSRASLEQVLRGSDAVMEDSKHLSNFLQTIGGDSAEGSQIQISHRCDRKRFFMDDNVAFMDFAASSVGAVNKGATNEIFFKGSMRASFSPASNKLISVDLTFDTGCISLQLERLGMSTPNEAHAAAAAAEAENLLDSLQMPQIFVEKNNATGTVSVSSDDGERSTDGSSSLVA